VALGGSQNYQTWVGNAFDNFSGVTGATRRERERRELGRPYYAHVKHGEAPANKIKQKAGSIEGVGRVRSSVDSMDNKTTQERRNPTLA